jgi:hypothetical protein
MSSTKQELINRIVHLLQTEFEGRASQVTAEDRSFLERSTVSYLESKLRELQSEVATRDPLAKERETLRLSKEAANRAKARLQIFTYSGLTNAQVNERLLDEFFPGPSLSFENFRNLIEQNPNIAARFIWAEQPFARMHAADGQQKQQQAQDRRNFATAAQAVTAQGLGDVRDCDANFSAVCEKLGTGFSAKDAVRVLTDGSITGLAPSGNAPELREQHRQKLVDDHNQTLLNADPATLRQVIRQEVTSQRQAAAQAQFDHELEFQSTHDTAMGKGELPATFNGQPLTAEYVKKASSDTLRVLIRRFGASAVTKLLNGIS